MLVGFLPVVARDEGAAWQAVGARAASGQQLGMRALRPLRARDESSATLPAMKPTPLCPSCRLPMEVHQPTATTMGWARRGGAGHLLCARASGLTTAKPQAQPQAVVELFTLLHQHRTDERRPLQRQWSSLALRAPAGAVVRRGAAAAIWCTAARSSTALQRVFFSVEKSFVRHLTRAEVDDLARRVDAIYCTGCGAGGHSQRPRLPAPPRRVLAD